MTQDGGANLIRGCFRHQVGVGPAHLHHAYHLKAWVCRSSRYSVVVQVARPRCDVDCRRRYRYSATPEGSGRRVRLADMAACWPLRGAPGSCCTTRARTSSPNAAGLPGCYAAGSGDRYGQNSSGKLVAEAWRRVCPTRVCLRDVISSWWRPASAWAPGAKNLQELRDQRALVASPPAAQESHRMT